MSRKAQSTHWDSRSQERLHKDKLQRKYEKRETLRALLEMWEANPDHDHAYILELRAKLRSVENQLSAMSI
jgi:hypothetical protein